MPASRFTAQTTSPDTIPLPAGCRPLGELLPEEPSGTGRPVASPANPGGLSHSAVKARYIDATDYGKKVITDDGGRTVRFIPSSMLDNPHLDEGYRQRLMAMPEPMRSAMRDGNWDVFAGMAFPDFHRDRILVPPFEVPEEWDRFAGVDYGWRAPSAVLWGAKDQDSRLWLYAELTMRQTAEREQAQRILAMERGQDIQVRAADPAMWGRTGSALPPAKQFALEGCALRKADNDRLGGKARIHTYLAEAPPCAHHRALGWTTCPSLHILDTMCPELVRTMPALPVDPHRPEDCDTNGEDHHVDALKYLLLSIGTAPSMIFDETPTEHELVQVGAYAYRPGDLSIPARTPIPGVTPGVAREPGTQDWSQP